MSRKCHMLAKGKGIYTAIYLLQIVSIAFSPIILVGLLVNYLVSGKEGNDFHRSHNDFQLKSSVTYVAIVLVFGLIGSIFYDSDHGSRKDHVLIFFALVGLLALHIWVLVRAILGLSKLGKGEAIP